MKNKNFGRKRQAIYISSNRKSTRIIKTLMDFFFFIKVKIKMVCFSVPSSFLRGGFLFLSFSFIIESWISYKRSLQIIMKKSNILFIPDLLRWKILIRWSTVVILLMVVPCMAVSTAEISSLFLSVVTAVSALPAVINIPWIALPLCPLSSLMSDTVIAFLPLMRPSVIFSCRIAL